MSKRTWKFFNTGPELPAVLGELEKEHGVVEAVYDTPIPIDRLKPERGTIPCVSVCFVKNEYVEKPFGGFPEGASVPGSYVAEGVPAFQGRRTVTGRIQSSRPNMGNEPRSEADGPLNINYKDVELRVLASSIQQSGELLQNLLDREAATKDEENVRMMWDLVTSIRDKWQEEVEKDLPISGVDCVDWLVQELFPYVEAVIAGADYLPRRFASTAWTVNDLEDYDWSDEAKEAWLEANSNHIREAMVHAGHTTIDQRMGCCANCGHLIVAGYCGNRDCKFHEYKQSDMRGWE